MNKIKTKHNWHPNTSLEFTSKGVWLKVSLNIEPSIVRFLSKNNVTKGGSMFVYALRSFIDSDRVNKNNMESIHKMLLKNCMKNIRKAKEKRRFIIENKYIIN